MVDVFPSDILPVRSKVVARRAVDMSPTHQKQYVPAAGGRRRSDDVGAAPGHVPGRAVPLLAAVCLQVLQVECVTVVQQQGLAGPRRHVHSGRCVKTISVRVGRLLPPHRRNSYSPQPTRDAPTSPGQCIAN